MKRNIILSSILVVSLIVFALSGTYAYISSKIENTGQSGVNVTGGNLDIDFSTDETSQYISVQNASLIKDNDVTNLQNNNYSKFGIKLEENSDAKNAKYTIY